MHSSSSLWSLNLSSLSINPFTFLLHFSSSSVTLSPFPSFSLSPSFPLPPPCVSRLQMFLHQWSLRISSVELRFTKYYLGQIWYSWSGDQREMEFCTNQKGIQSNFWPTQPNREKYKYTYNYICKLSAEKKTRYVHYIKIIFVFLYEMFWRISQIQIINKENTIRQQNKDEITQCLTRGQLLFWCVCYVSLHLYASKRLGRDYCPQLYTDWITIDHYWRWPITSCTDAHNCISKRH